MMEERKGNDWASSREIWAYRNDEGTLTFLFPSDIVKYEVVIFATHSSDDGIEGFTRHVNEKLANGWILQGGVCCYPIPDAPGCMMFCQAVWRIEEGQC